MPVDIDKDTASAIQALWNSHGGTGDLVGVCGPLKVTLPSPEPALYVQLTVKKASKTNDRHTGISFIDYREVTFTVRGPEDKLADAAALILAVFNRRHLLPSDIWQAFPGAETLTYPSGAYFMKWEPLNDGERSLVKGRKKGEEVWAWKLMGEIQSVRVEDDSAVSTAMESRFDSTAGG